MRIKYTLKQNMMVSQYRNIYAFNGRVAKNHVVMANTKVDYLSLQRNARAESE